MQLHGESHFCTIPIVVIPSTNETSEAEAKVAERQELARATDRGWELLQELEGDCLYFVSGYWSYAFCYNNELTQFHQLPPQPGKPMIPPQRDPSTKQFVLGRAKAKEVARADGSGNQVDVRNSAGKAHDPPKTELQVKGDTRYLVQKMEGGTTCDLTGKPRRVEVQFHCNPHVTDRIGYIKEVTTCSYLLVVYAPRLCNDVAFMPQKEKKANSITCRIVVPSDEIESRTELKTLEIEAASKSAISSKPITMVGGLVLGGGKWMNKDGARMPIPPNFGQPIGPNTQKKTTEVIARAKSNADGGQVEMASEKELRKLDLDPQMVESLKEEIRKMAAGKGWKIEVVDEPGQVREILGIVDGDDEDEEGEGEGEDDGEWSREEEAGEGSEEVFYRDEL